MKNIAQSLIAVSLLSSIVVAGTDLDSSLSQDHTFEREVVKEQGIEIVDGWEVSGDIRAGWVQYDYQNKPTGIDSSGKILATDPSINKGHIDSKGIYLVPKVSIISPKDSRMHAKVTIAGATDFGINDEKYESRTFVFDPNVRKSFMIMQETGYTIQVHLQNLVWVVVLSPLFQESLV